MPLVISQLFYQVLDFAGAGSSWILLISKLLRLSAQFAPQLNLVRIHIRIWFRLMHSQSFKRLASATRSYLTGLLYCIFQLSA